MSNLPQLTDPEDDLPQKSPNILLMYVFLAMAILAALAFAAAIVYPFYKRL
jgi:hypothetical protein